MKQQRQRYTTDTRVIKLLDAKLDFILMQSRWLVECSFHWLACFRRLVRDYGRSSESLACISLLRYSLP